ncbi:MAG: hypothetical protein OXF02_05860 [Simkaniaceae bacterium]|nr:hypothetical protein [Simkaniaceae bacterium]
MKRFFKSLTKYILCVSMIGFSYCPTSSYAEEKQRIGNVRDYRLTGVHCRTDDTFNVSGKGSPPVCDVFFEECTLRFEFAEWPRFPHLRPSDRIVGAVLWKTGGGTIAEFSGEEFKYFIYKKDAYFGGFSVRNKKIKPMKIGDKTYDNVSVMIGYEVADDGREKFLAWYDFDRS